MAEMRTFRIEALKNQRVISEKCIVAESFLLRLRGLIGRRSMEIGEAMWFPRCSSIHMWWMSIAIDVVFLRPSRSGNSRRWEVVSVHSGVRPWRLLPLGDRRASAVLELAAGAAGQGEVLPGDEFECIG